MSAATPLRDHFRTINRDLWYTLQIENYMAGDVVRAAVEEDLMPQVVGMRRLHVHAVSSAYGLLGHDYGRRILGLNETGTPPSYLLVQHLGTSDMVDNLNAETHPELDKPAYELSAETGCYVQDVNPYYPTVTFDPAELLEPTFYSKKPATSTKMNQIIQSQGGGGIVVSSAECVESYGQVRRLLDAADLHLPKNPFDEVFSSGSSL